MLPTIPIKRKVRTDAMAQMQDTNAISQAAVPQGDIAKAPTLGRTYRPAPQKGPVQGAGQALPQAPQRMAFGERPPASAPKPPMAPRTDVLAGVAAGLRDRNKPVIPSEIDVNADRGPVTGAVRGGDPISTTVGVTKPAPLSPEAQAQADRDVLDQQIRDFVSGRVAGANDVDTTEQEALIRDLVEGKTGQALVDQRARGGRAGFATSGAQQAIEGDIRKQAGQAASGDILDLRRTEQQRAFDNATRAIQTESGMRSAASDDALRRMFLESLQAESGLETGVGGETNPFDVSGAETPTTPARGGASTDSAILVDAPPAGAVAVPGAAGIYYVEDGKYSDGSPRRKYYKVNA